MLKERREQDAEQNDTDEESSFCSSGDLEHRVPGVLKRIE
jgi:hypothetical protein